VQSDKVEEVADKLAKISNFSSVVILASKHDIVVVGYFKSTDELYKIINDQIIKMPGVKKTETSLVLKRVKRAY
jgi:DNA-binding Lrp family transcriptional regulator